MDKLQERLAGYACALNYEGLSPEAIHAAKVRVIDTLGCLIGGLSAEPSRIAREMAAQVSGPMAATILGTREKSTPEMAAFANAATARYLDYNDTYHGRSGGHPSDNITPVLAAAEPMHASGREFLTAVTLAYEVWLRVADSVGIQELGWDYTTWSALASGVAAGKILGLSSEQMAQCISLAVVPNNALGQTRKGQLSMWKAVAAGQAGKAGVFAALLARQGMEGPNLPFEGDKGFFNAVCGEAFSLEALGGNGTPFKISDTIIKPYAACGTTQSSIGAALAVRPKLRGVEEIEAIRIDAYDSVIKNTASGREKWHPETRETADHSTPYVVAAALMDGTVGPRQFTEERIGDPELLALVQKIQAVSNPEFTRAYESHPQAHTTRVEVVVRSGERHVGVVHSIKGDPSDPMTDGEIEEKFRNQTEEFLGKERVRAILDRLWRLEEIEDVAEIPSALAP